MTRDRLCFSVMLVSFAAGFVSIAALRFAAPAPWAHPVLIAAIGAWILCAAYYFLGNRE
ncbi:MAG: hypothetical protein V4559_02390 [Pseudomonadota bacterium]